MAAWAVEVVWGSRVGGAVAGDRGRLVSGGSRRRSGDRRPGPCPRGMVACMPALQLSRSDASNSRSISTV
jgi:hypothetical protein